MDGDADRPEIATLRTRVVVEEQGVPAEIEQDSPVGAEYEEAGTAHITMRRRLRAADGADVTDRSGDAKTRPVRPSE